MDFQGHIIGFTATLDWVLLIIVQEIQVSYIKT